MSVNTFTRNLPLESAIPLRSRRIFVNSPQIYRSEAVVGARFRQSIEGRKFLLRSDFPVLLYQGDKPIAWAGGASHPSHMRFTMPSGASHQVEFRYPPREGGDFLSGLGDPARIRHGCCVLESSWSDEHEPELPSQFNLPSISFAASVAILAAATSGVVIQQPGVADFTVPGAGWRVMELWLTSVEFNLETAAALLFATGEHAYEWQHTKLASGVTTDQTNFFQVFGNGRANHCDMQLLKLPWGSIMTPWNAEVPTVLNTVFLSAAAPAAGLIALRWNGFYTVSQT